MRIGCGLVLALLCLSAPAAAAERCDGAALLRTANLNPFHRAYILPGPYGACVLPPGASEAIASLDAASHLTGARSGPGNDRDRRRDLASGARPAARPRGRVGAFRGAVGGLAQRRRVRRLHRGLARGLPACPRAGATARRAAGSRSATPGTGRAGSTSTRTRSRWGTSRSGSAARWGRGFFRTTVWRCGARRGLPAGGADGLAGASGAVWAETSGTLSGASRTWLYGAALGVLAADPPDALAAVSDKVVAFGRLGLTWRPLPGLALKLQVDASSPPHGGSSLAPLSDPAVAIGMGGTVRLGGSTTLDLAVVEDDGAHRAVPDVGVHVALRWRP